MEKKFELTPEEVKLAKKLISKGLDTLGKEIKKQWFPLSRRDKRVFHLNWVDGKSDLQHDGYKLIDKIKQWEDEILSRDNN